MCCGDPLYRSFGWTAPSRLPIAFWYHHPKRSPTVVCQRGGAGSTGGHGSLFMPRKSFASLPDPVAPAVIYRRLFRYHFSFKPRWCYAAIILTAAHCDQPSGRRAVPADTDRFLYRDDLKLHTPMALCGVCCYNKK